MDNQQIKAIVKKKVKKSDSSTIKISKETKRELNKILVKVNKKDFGRRIRGEKIVLLALQQINKTHIKELQDSTLSNEDKLEMKYREYVSKNGNISKDEFIGKLLLGESLSNINNQENE